MQTSFFKTLLILVLAFLVIFGAQALDDNGNPNNPNENPNSNACYEDGSMAGKCDTPEKWEAGWYLIRFEYGLISRENFPSYFSWALPEEVQEDSAPANCFTNGTYSLLYNGNSGSLNNFTIYNSTDCTGSTLPRSTLSTESPFIIVASTSSSAGATCQSVRPGSLGIDSLSAYGYASPSSYYVCVI
jgi:hypothetical protein